jgi:hypothetical protein
MIQITTSLHTANITSRIDTRSLFRCSHHNCKTKQRLLYSTLFAGVPSLKVVGRNLFVAYSYALSCHCTLCFQTSPTRPVINNLSSYGGFQVPVEARIKTTLLWVVAPRSPVRVHRRFRDGSCLIALTMEAASTSETSVKFYQVEKQPRRQPSLFLCLHKCTFLHEYMPRKT